MRLRPLLLLAIAVSSPSIRAQTSGTMTSSGSGPVSPAVVATWICHYERSDFGELDLLVLWRGTPGWFMRGGSGGSSGQSGGGRGGRPPVVQHLFFGDLALDLQFDPQAHTAQIQDREISLKDANVILVDAVDSAEGLKVAGTRWIEPYLSESPVRIETLLQRSPELITFLRCDIGLPDPTMQKMMELMCARMRGQTDNKRFE
jgi:hypothetical protein